MPTMLSFMFFVHQRNGWHGPGNREGVLGGDNGNKQALSDGRPEWTQKLPQARDIDIARKST